MSIFIRVGDVGIFFELGFTEVVNTDPFAVRFFLVGALRLEDREPIFRFFIGFTRYYSAT
jgi:hypothetical protein